MPPNVRTLRYTQRALDFSGGLNLADPPTEIPDNQLVKCDNMWYPSGILTKRPGFFKLNNTPLTVSGGDSLFVLGYNPLSGKYVITSFGGTIITEITNNGTVTTVTGTITQQARWMLYINGTTYLGFNGNMGIRTLTGGAISGATVVNSPQSNIGTWHKSRIFTDVITTPGRIAFSDPNAPGTWQVASTLDVGVDDNEAISAIVSLGDLLLIFKSSTVYSLFVQGNSPADWVIRKISDFGIAPTPGNAAHYHNGSVYFISKLGVFKTNGSSFAEISKNIWNPLNPLYSLQSGIGFSNWRITRFVDHLIFAYFDRGSVGYTYAYNIDTGAWSSWNFLGNTRGFDDVWVNQGNQYPELLAISGGTVYYLNTNTAFNYDTILAAGINSYSDNLLINTLGTGSAYTSQFTSKEIASFIDWYWRVKWASLEYIARGSPSFNMIHDGVAGSVVTPGFHATLRKGYKIPGAGRVRVFQLNCSHALTSPFEFYRGEFHFTIKTHISASGTP